MNDAAAYLTPSQLARRLNLTRRRLMLWRRDGKGPRAEKWGYRTVRYAIADVEAWEAANRSASACA